MKYFVFRLRWSQTDEEICIVKAHTEEDARSKIKAKARYIDSCSSTGSVIE